MSAGPRRPRPHPEHLGRQSARAPRRGRWAKQAHTPRTGAAEAQPHATPRALPLHPEGDGAHPPRLRHKRNQVKCRKRPGTSDVQIAPGQRRLPPGQVGTRDTEPPQAVTQGRKGSCCPRGPPGVTAGRGRCQGPQGLPLLAGGQDGAHRAEGSWAVSDKTTHTQAARPAGLLLGTSQQELQTGGTRRELHGFVPNCRRGRTETHLAAPPRTSSRL